MIPNVNSITSADIKPPPPLDAELLKGLRDETTR
jgi:hypothetical protein